MVVNSFTTQTGQSTGLGKSSSNGRTLIHSARSTDADGVMQTWSGGSISAACFINSGSIITNM